MTVLRGVATILLSARKVAFNVDINYLRCMSTAYFEVHYSVVFDVLHVVEAYVIAVPATTITDDILAQQLPGIDLSVACKELCANVPNCCGCLLLGLFCVGLCTYTTLSASACLGHLAAIARSYTTRSPRPASRCTGRRRAALVRPHQEMPCRPSNRTCRCLLDAQPVQIVTRSRRHTVEALAE